MLKMSELLLIARRLYERRYSGQIIPYKMVNPAHSEGECHQNAGLWARGCKAIHGWMVFDHERTSSGLVSLVQFNPHTIIETDSGDRFDITPSQASRRYPFLDHEGPREHFIQVVKGNSLSSVPSKSQRLRLCGQPPIDHRNLVNKGR